ncbi:hypothetical protein WMY93_008179 [Mugilogobius chulae]|uniref:Clathrin interactor 1 n=1 Tax=Mugilogobius chulae TaxID=88201 RepID=A0AAW0PLP4_9GOBI
MPQQPMGQQQKVGGPGVLGSTWSDPSVNISLDFLSAGLNPNKTPPTLNNIIQQQANSMGFGMPTSPPMTTGMPGTMTTGMNAGSMGIPGMMGMNMNMNLGMGTPVMMGVPAMGLTHSMSPAVVPPKQDAFANFGNFGK